MEKQKGVALILAIAILAVFSVFATSFALNMRLEYKIAKNYNNRVKAGYIAYAALQKAILELRENVKVSAFVYPTKFTSSVATAVATEFHSGYGSIEDEQGKLNVNNCTEDELEELIRFLVNYSAAPVYGLSISDAKKIMNVKPASGFSHLEDIIVQSKLAAAGIDTDAWKALSRFITVHGYEDPSHSNRSPVNINSASLPLIATVVKSASSLSRDMSWKVAVDIKLARDTGHQEFVSWEDINDFIDAISYMSTSEKTDLKNGLNPNRAPSSKGAIKCCFHPGGYYRLWASGSTADLSSSREIHVVVKISERYVETTKEQFLKGTANEVTIADNCPIYPATVPGKAECRREDAIKLGFWDDFDEADVSGIGWSSATGTFDIRDEDGDGDKELVQTSSFGVFVPPIKAENFYFNAFFDDLSGGVQMKNVGWLLFRGITPGSPCAIHNRTGMLEWGGAWAYDVSGAGNIQFLTNSAAAGMGFTPADRYIYPAGLRLWPDDNQDSAGNRTLYAYSENIRQIRVLTHNSSAHFKVRTSQPYRTYNRSDIPSPGSGDFGLYGDSSRVAWDNVRIIGPSGTFSSASFNPPEGVVKWGTITGTIAFPDEGDIVLTLNSAGPPYVDLDSNNPYGAIGITSDFIRWHAAFTQEGVISVYYTMNCPILEDVTITYLPKTQLVSYTAY